MQVSYVLAAYNEECIIKTAIARCVDALNRDFDDYELILVDDASKDGTLNIMRECAEKNPKIRVLENYVNLNFGASILRGVKAASKEWIIYNAADLPVRPEDTKRILEAAKKADVLVLERMSYKGTLWRRLTSECNAILLKILYPQLVKGTPVLNFVQVFRRSVIDSCIPLARSPIFVWPEMIFRAKKAGLRVVNLKYHPDFRGKARKGAFGRPHDIIWGIYDMLRFKIRCMNNNI